MLDKLKKAFDRLIGKDNSIGLVKEAIAGIIQIRLNQSEIERISNQLFYDLLDADVPFELASYIKKQLIKELEQSRFSKDYKQEIREILKRILLQYIRTASIPDKGIMMLIGPNGYGKTTTAVKIGYMLKKSGKIVKIIGADVFRAAAREQLKELASKYNIDYYIDQSDRPINTIYRGLIDKHKYDWILIDTAGRQDMRVNLLKELQSIQDKVKPDVTLYVVESSVGNSILNQLRDYRRFIKIDGIIYTKMDLDSAGGSILAAGYYDFPIYFITTGQDIDSIEIPNPNSLVERIL